jgi:glutathione-independent formaldehyde dehydrogenase
VVLPGRPGDDNEDDCVMLADAFVTGWHATELARVEPTRSVAVFGAGTIGLLTAYSALIKGAAEVYVVDYIAVRLDKAEELGATPVDFSAGNPVEQIREMRRHHLRPGEEQMDGVDHAIDAVGFQARSRGDRDTESPRQVIADMARIVNPLEQLGSSACSPH